MQAQLLILGAAPLLGATLAFASVFLAGGLWFCARTENVAQLDSRLSARFLRPGNRRPRIGSPAYKLLFRTTGALLILVGLALFALVGIALLLGRKMP